MFGLKTTTTYEYFFKDNLYISSAIFSPIKEEDANNLTHISTLGHLKKKNEKELDPEQHKTDAAPQH
jgi:hypothetical protein